MQKHSAFMAVRLGWHHKLLFLLLVTAVNTTNGNVSRATCTFDQDASICGYIQDKTDVFDWTWTSGGTASAGTGPRTDHTTGTSAGEISCC